MGTMVDFMCLSFIIFVFTIGQDVEIHIIENLYTSVKYKYNRADLKRVTEESLKH